MNTGWLGLFQRETGKKTGMSDQLVLIVIELKFQFQISKHLDKDQKIKSDTELAAGEVLSGGDEEVGVVVPAVADGYEVL